MDFYKLLCRPGFGVTLLDRTASLNDDLEKTFKDIRKNLLEMINEERDVEKVPPVAVGRLCDSRWLQNTPLTW